MDKNKYYFLDYFLMKECRHCKRSLDDTQFNNCKQNKDGLGSYCKECNTEVQWEWRIQKRYGITADEYWQMVTDQDDKCLICGYKDPKKKLSIDHDHATGRVRGLLCNHCNMAIGYLRDDPASILNAIIYLSKT